MRCCSQCHLGFTTSPCLPARDQIGLCELVQNQIFPPNLPRRVHCSLGKRLAWWTDHRLELLNPRGWPPSIGAYTLSVPFSSTTSTYSFLLTNVYAPSNHSEINAFFDEFKNIQPSHDWIAIGDYNLTRAPSDKNNDIFN